MSRVSFAVAFVVVLSLVLAIAAACTKEVVKEVVKEVEVIKEVQVEVVVEKVVEVTPVGPVRPSGTLRVATENVGTPSFLPSKMKVPVEGQMHGFGVLDTLIYLDPTVEAPARGLPTGDGVAEGWTLNSDATGITFQIHQGIDFHKGWGPLTASDVAYSFNEALLTEGTVAKRAEHGQWMGRWTADDTYVVSMVTKDGEVVPPVWEEKLSQYIGQGQILSKKVYDDLGPDLANQTFVGSGPFSVEKWVGDEEVLLEAVVPHWRQTPGVEFVHIRQIPEAATRVAALVAGEVDIAEIPLTQADYVIKNAGASIKAYYAFGHRAVYFGGNFWQKTNHLTGEPMERRPGFKPDDEHPWIGDPDDPVRHERAKKVRLAMSLALDRELLIERIMLGYGDMALTLWDFPLDGPDFKPAWGEEFAFDPERANALLDEAGYPDGFEAGFFVAPDTPGAFESELGEAIAQMWRDNLGLKIKMDTTAYAARRPTLVDRSIDILFGWGKNVASIDAPQTYNMVYGLGWNPAVEIPCIAEGFVKNKSESDRATRVATNIGVQDCISDLLPAITLFQTTSPIAAVRPEVDWTPLSCGTLCNFESAVFKK